MSSARLSLVIASLSLATEAAAGVAPETASRAAIVAVRLAERLGMSVTERRDVYYAALLRYIGCSSLAHEMAWYGAGDDIALLRALTPADSGNLLSTVGFVVRDAARDQGVRARVRAVSRLLGEPKFGHRLAHAHCEQATHLAAGLGAGAGVTAILAQAYERFDGKGGDIGLSGERILPLARVLHVAYCAVLHASFNGPRAALEVLKRRAGGELDPGMVQAVLPFAEELLEQLLSASVWDLLAASEPSPRESVTDLSAVARAFAQFVDLKSPYTLGHSVGVARTLETVLTAGGATAEEIETGRVAGWLHDLGRSSVSNGIWDKPGPLNRLELERARDHAGQSERILERAELLPDLVAVVGAHHERLDGSGYPRRMGGAALSRLARLLAAADVKQALSEERAYRAAYGADDVARILEEETKAGRLDRDAVSEVLGRSNQSNERQPPAGLSEREVEVLILVARGLTNKQIGQRLFISPRTVGHHVAHIYDKTSVKTRAAAALFAVEHDLVSDPAK